MSYPLEVAVDSGKSRLYVAFHPKNLVLGRSRLFALEYSSFRPCVNCSPYLIVEEDLHNYLDTSAIRELNQKDAEITEKLTAVGEKKRVHNLYI